MMCFIIGTHPLSSVFLSSSLCFLLYTQQIASDATVSQLRLGIPAVVHALGLHAASSSACAPPHELELELGLRAATQAIG